jgi:hypothetical protein
VISRQVWGLWASGTAAATGSRGLELLAELTAAGPGSPVGAGTKGIQHLHDFAKSARRSGLEAARRHLLMATFR